MLILFHFKQMLNVQMVVSVTLSLRIWHNTCCLFSAILSSKVSYFLFLNITSIDTKVNEMDNHDLIFYKLFFSYVGVWYCRALLPQFFSFGKVTIFRQGTKCNKALTFYDSRRRQGKLKSIQMVMYYSNWIVHTNIFCEQWCKMV